MTSSSGMLTNNDLMPRYAVKQSQVCWRISLAESNASLRLYSLKVKSLSIGTKNVATLYKGLPKAEKISRKAGKLSVTF